MAAAGSAHEAYATPRAPADDELRLKEVGESAMRKASLRLLPVIGVGYGLAYMDRINISFASLQMNRDLHFSASVYGFGAGLFFIGYALCEVPSNLLLMRFGAKRWLARIMFTWGLLAAAMMFVRTPLEFNALRFLLGMAEAGFFPGTGESAGGEPVLCRPAAKLGGDGLGGGLADGAWGEAGTLGLAMAFSS